MKIRNDIKCVYIIENRELNRIKIGYSGNISRRFRCIRTQSGCEMNLVYHSKPIIEYAEIEEKMHDRFSEYRGIGEWFSVNPDEAVIYLKQLTNVATVCEVVKMYESGMNATQIAERIQVSRSGVVKYLKDMGYIKKPASRMVQKPKKIIFTGNTLSQQRIQEMVEATNNRLGKRAKCRA